MHAAIAKIATGLEEDWLRIYIYIYKYKYKGYIYVCIHIQIYLPDIDNVKCSRTFFVKQWLS